MIKLIFASAISLTVGLAAGIIIGKHRGRKNENLKSSDINNIVNGIAHKDKLEKLYKSLIVKVHPDKHPNNKELADKYTTLINNNRRNFDKMNELKEEIEQRF